MGFSCFFLHFFFPCVLLSSFSLSFLMFLSALSLLPVLLRLVFHSGVAGALHVVCAPYWVVLGDVFYKSVNRIEQDCKSFNIFCILGLLTHVTGLQASSYLI